MVLVGANPTRIAARTQSGRRQLGRQDAEPADAGKNLFMSIATIHPEEGPLASGGFLVIEFDPRTAHMAVHGDVSYAESTFDSALADAQEATEISASSRLPLQYVVVRIERTAAFRPV
jgi:hypothetical protein